MSDVEPASSAECFRRASLSFDELLQDAALAMTIGTQTADHQGGRAFVEKQAPLCKGH